MHERNEMMNIVIKGRANTFKTTIAELITRRLESLGAEDIITIDPDNFPVSDAEFTEIINKVKETKGMSILTVYSLFNEIVSAKFDNKEVRIEYSSDTLTIEQIAPLMMDINKELESLGATAGCYFNRVVVEGASFKDVSILGEIKISVVHTPNLGLLGPGFQRGIPIGVPNKTPASH